MPKYHPPLDVCRELWQRALEAEIGVEILVDNVRSFQIAMYEARKGYPQYADIVMCLPDGVAGVFLVKKMVEQI